MTTPFDASLDDSDSLHEECAVFGVYGTSDSAHLLTALGLHIATSRPRSNRDGGF